MQKGIYLPTKQNTIVLNELEEYCDGHFIQFIAYLQLEER